MSSLGTLMVENMDVVFHEANFPLMLEMKINSIATIKIHIPNHYVVEVGCQMV